MLIINRQAVTDTTVAGNLCAPALPCGEVPRRPIEDLVSGPLKCPSHGVGVNVEAVAADKYGSHFHVTRLAGRSIRGR